MQNFKMEIGLDGIVLLAFDVPDKAVNVVSHAMIAELGQIATDLRGNDAVKGVILFSAKTSGFGTGVDLTEMLTDVERWRAAAGQEALRACAGEAAAFTNSLRALETCDKPVAGITHGVTLGGAFELLLACHYRVAVDTDSLNIALPEVSLGLMPGAGASQRLVRLVGLMAALPWLLDSQPITLADALAGKIVHAAVPTQAAALDEARRWIIEEGNALAPWDVKGFKLPGGGPHSLVGYMHYSPAIAARCADKRPGIRNILKAVYEGAQVPIDAALRIESRYFFNTVRSHETRAHIEKLLASRKARSRG